jgi:hypothetical protein
MRMAMWAIRHGCVQTPTGMITPSSPHQFPFLPKVVAQAVRVEVVTVPQRPEWRPLRLPPPRPRSTLRLCYQSNKPKRGCNPCCSRATTLDVTSLAVVMQLGCSITEIKGILTRFPQNTPMAFECIVAIPQPRPRISPRGPRVTGDGMQHPRARFRHPEIYKRHRNAFQQWEQRLRFGNGHPRPSRHENVKGARWPRPDALNNWH